MKINGIEVPKHVAGKITLYLKTLSGEIGALAQKRVELAAAKENVSKLEAEVAQANAEASIFQAMLDSEEQVP